MRRAATRLVTGVVSLSAGAILLSGCGFGQLQLHTLADSAAKSAATITATAGTPIGTEVAPDAPLVVTAAAGRLTEVTVTGPEGTLDGSLSSDGTTWTSQASALDYGTSYAVQAAAVDRLGAPTSVQETLTTLKPDKLLSVESVAPSGTVGIGIPMKVTLSRGISGDKARQTVESHLSVTANGKPVKGGAWRWDSDSVLHFRPPKFWPGNSTIELHADLKGARITKKVWGESDSVNTWKTGPAMISYVNLQTHMMRVTRDGQTIREIPITGGKAGFESRSGIKVILTKETSRRMDAATGGTMEGDPEYYNLVVYWAMRLTESGEFLHAAPWSVGSQGSANVSHGCTGMSTANAQWLFENSEVGDVVIYTGSSRQMTIDNGIGDWNVPLDRWAAGYDS